MYTLFIKVIVHVDYICLIELLFDNAFISSQYLFIAINSGKTTVENEKENLTERLSQLDEEVKKVKKDLQESREKLKRSDEVRYSVFVFD